LAKSLDLVSPVEIFPHTKAHHLGAIPKQAVQGGHIIARQGSFVLMVEFG
jgi:hypothetical protein